MMTSDSVCTLRSSDNHDIKISVDCIESSGLRREITKTLLEDPNSEVKRMAEDYLIQCLYEATEDPEKNPILNKFFGGFRELREEVKQIAKDIEDIKSELSELKYVTSKSKEEEDCDFDYLEAKLKKITERLEKAGININNWTN